MAGFKSSSINRIDDWIDAVNAQNRNDGNVETHGRASLPRLHGIKKFNKNNPLWQNNYHDHIIRNETEYRRISEYIVNNPLKWDKDTLSNGEHCEQEG